MPELLGNAIVLLALGTVVVLCIRSLWRSHKHGGGCSGNCGSCGSCGGGCGGSCDCQGK